MKNTAPQQNDDDLRRNIISDTMVALGFLTRLRLGDQETRRPLASAVRGFAPAGFLIGLLTGTVYLLAVSCGVPVYLGVVVAMAFNIYITGALHEDGLADTVDGFGGAWQRKDKLRIMRDSQIGSYGVLSLIIAVLLRAGAYFSIIGADGGVLHTVLIFAAIGGVSRSFFGMMMVQMDLARDDGLAATSGKPSPEAARALLIFGLAGTLILLWIATGLFAGLLVIAAAGLAYYLVKRLSERHIGGYTGDVAGALQQISEILCLIVLTAAV